MAVRAALIVLTALAALAAPTLPAAWAQPGPAPVGNATAPTPPAPELLCNLRTGDETRTLRVPPSPDPLAAATAVVADRFALRATLLSAPAALGSPDASNAAHPPDAPTPPALAVVTIVDLESATPAQILAQGRWPLQGQAMLPADAPWAPLLTGWQRSYSPHLGRELAWGCALAAAGASPSGWAEVEATLPGIAAPAGRDGGLGTAALAAAYAASPGEGESRAPPVRPAAPPAPAPAPAPASAPPSPSASAPASAPASPLAPASAATSAVRASTASDPATQPSAVPPPATGPTVRLAWMGDVMLADGPGRVVARGGDPSAGVAALLRQADLRIANLECVIATGGRAVAKPWTFRAHPRTLAELKRHVDAVSLANNHSGDYGAQAFAEMLGRLQRAGLPAFGGGADLRSAHQPLILQRNGLRIALLAYNEMFPRAFEAGEHTPGIAWADDEKIAAAIHAARAQADVVIPFMHWGQEHSPTAHARQRALARLMIRAGADAVVGTHPHVRQDTELIDGRPVIYSLGNFVFDGFTDADNNTGSILWMTVDRHGVVDWRLQAVGIDQQGRPYVQAR